MNKKENIKYSNLPIISKEKIYTENTIEAKGSKIITAVLIISIIFILLFCGYSMAKSIEEYVINSKAEIAEPILVVENDPSIDINDVNNSGIYNFKIKNYNEENQITQTDLKYCIEILHNENNLVDIELYQGEDKIELDNNKTEYMQISKDVKEEREYKIKITYNEDSSNTINDIMQKIQVRVYSEQVEV